MKAIDIKQLKKTYASGRMALDGIDLAIDEGDFFALLGPNGAGKTTMIGILTSLVNKSSGSVSVFNHNIDSDSTAAKHLMGVVPQEFNFNVFERVIDIILNQAGYYGIPRRIAYQRAEAILTPLGLWDRRNQVSRQLSGGMKRRLMIARALIHQPKILILDEPTAGVDVELRRSMWDFLKQLNTAGTTIILTTHYLEEAEALCRGVAIINHGKIIQHTTVKQLLSMTNTQTIRFELAQPTSLFPAIPGCEIVMVDPLTVEITFPKTLLLTEIFSVFVKENIGVVSVRNTTHGLEALFLQLVQKGSHP